MWIVVTVTGWPAVRCTMGLMVGPPVSGVEAGAIGLAAVVATEGAELGDGDNCVTGARVGGTGMGVGVGACVGGG
jgi:hypothetical protein